MRVQRWADTFPSDNRMQYTYTLNGTADDKRQGRITLSIVDLTYNVSWSTLVTSYGFLDQNQHLKGESLEKEQILAVFSEFVYACFTQQKGTRLVIEVSGTQQLTFKCKQESTDLSFVGTLAFDTHSNFVSLIDDVKGAFVKKFEPVNDTLTDLQRNVQLLLTRVGNLESIFSRMVVEGASSVVGTPLDVFGRPVGQAEPERQAETVGQAEPSESVVQEVAVETEVEATTEASS